MRREELLPGPLGNERDAVQPTVHPPMQPIAFSRTNQMARKNDPRPQAERPDQRPRIKRRERILEMMHMDNCRAMAQHQPRQTHR